MVTQANWFIDNRNLYAIDYIKKNGAITRDEFRDVWDNLDKTTKDVSSLSPLYVSHNRHLQSYKQLEKDAKKKT